MKKVQLQKLLDAEIDALARKSYTALVEELSDVLAYARGNGDDFHQFEVQMVEHEPDYVHVIVSIDDGRLSTATKPLTGDVMVYRDGRVQR